MKPAMFRLMFLLVTVPLLLAACAAPDQIAVSSSPPAATILPTPTSAPTQNRFTPHEFTARVGDVRLQSQLIESGKSNEDFVTVNVSAFVYAEPIVVEDARTASTSDLPEEVKFLVAYTKANLQGSPEEIAEYWAPSIRAGKLELVEKYYVKNREIMAKNPGLIILAIVRHGDDSISVINKLSKKVVIGVTISEKDGRLFLKDKPNDDLELAIIEASFQD